MSKKTMTLSAGKQSLTPEMQRQYSSQLDGTGISKKTNENMTPTSAAFKDHFETLMNRENQQTMKETTSECRCIPILDDHNTPIEVEDALKKTKSKGYIGNSPTLLK